MTLAESIVQIRTSEITRNGVVTKIFNDHELKNKVVAYIRKHGGSQEDGLYVFDEMIVQFIKTAFAKNEKQYTGELHPYLLGIVHHLWYKEIQKKTKTTHLESALEERQPAYEEIFLNKERYALLSIVLDKLRSNCRAVLMHWANGYSMEEIANAMGYQSEGMARKKKSQCMAQLNEFLLQNPHIKNQLQ